MSRRRYDNEVERVEIPVSTAEIILRRCQPGIDVAPTVMLANKAIFTTPNLSWLESVALNCYSQGMMDMLVIVERQVGKDAMDRLLAATVYQKGQDD